MKLGRTDCCSVALNVRLLSASFCLPVHVQLSYRLTLRCFNSLMWTIWSGKIWNICDLCVTYLIRMQTSLWISVSLSLGAWFYVFCNKQFELKCFDLQYSQPIPELLNAELFAFFVVTCSALVVNYLYSLSPTKIWPNYNMILVTSVSELIHRRAPRKCHTSSLMALLRPYDLRQLWVITYSRHI